MIKESHDGQVDDNKAISENTIPIVFSTDNHQIAAVDSVIV